MSQDLSISYHENRDLKILLNMSLFLHFQFSTKRNAFQTLAKMAAFVLRFQLPTNAHVHLALEETVAKV